MGWAWVLIVDRCWGGGGSVWRSSGCRVGVREGRVCGRGGEGGIAVWLECWRSN